MGNKVHFTLLGDGNYVQGTRVPQDDQGSAPTLAAAVVRPGRQRSMNMNDLLHQVLAHGNEATIKETSKQLGIKVTSLVEFCDTCAEAKAFNVSTSRFLSPLRIPPRPFHRVVIDLAGGYAASTGGARFLMMILDLCTNYGWTEFLPDKSGAAVLVAFKRWHLAVKALLERHGKIAYLLTDNGNEFTNAQFRHLLVDLNMTTELTSVDGAKSNGQV